MRKIYLSGPMRGYPESNYPLFNEMALKLRTQGHFVYNPAERPWDNARAAFADYCAFICNDACTMVMLPGWEISKGASCENALAHNVGIEVFEIGEMF